MKPHVLLEGLQHNPTLPVSGGGTAAVCKALHSVDGRLQVGCDARIKPESAFQAACYTALHTSPRRARRTGDKKNGTLAPLNRVKLLV